MAQLLQGKRVLIVGIANQRSIAYGIAEACYQWGAELALTYQGEKLKSRVASCAETLGNAPIFPCDVSQDQSIDELSTALQSHWGQFDALVHSVAFAPGELLQGDFTEVTTRSGFNTAHEISSYSLIALARAAKPMLNPNGAILTLSYLGAERVAPNYNVMGLAKASLEANVRYLANSLGPHQIRVNAISAGPVKTLAASGIQGFRKMLNLTAELAPLRDNVTPEQIGQTAAFLCSDHASAITGEVIHVDNGYHTVAIPSHL